MIVALDGRILWISPAKPGKDYDIIIIRDTIGEWFQVLRDEYGFGYCIFSFSSILFVIFYLVMLDLKEWNCIILVVHHLEILHFTKSMPLIVLL